MKNTLILILFLSSTFCSGQSPYENLLIPIVDTGNAFLDNFSNDVDTIDLTIYRRTQDGEVITPTPNDTIAVDLLISFRGLAIVVDGYIIINREYDVYLGGHTYFNEIRYLNENKKLFDKDIQIWQHKYK